MDRFLKNELMFLYAKISYLRGESMNEVTEKKSIFSKNIKDIDIKDIDIKKILNKEITFNKKRTGNLISIDIGSTDIKFLLGEYFENIFRVSVLESMTLPKDIYDSGFIKDEEIIIHFIRNFIEKHKITEQNVVLCVESADIIRREMSMPVMEKELAISTVKYEISEFLPIDIEKYIIQYSEIRREIVDGVENMVIMVYAFPEDNARHFYEVIEKAGLIPYALDIQSHCVEKLLKYKRINNIPVENKTVALIDIGNSGMGISIIKNKNLEFNRIVKGVISLREALVRRNLCAEYEVDDLLDSYGKQNIFTTDINESKIAIQEEMIFVIDAWITDILKLFQYYTSRSTSNRIDYVFIYGGGAKIKNIDLYIGSRLGIQTRKISSIDGLQVPYSSKDKEISKYINCISAIVGR